MFQFPQFDLNGNEISFISSPQFQMPLNFNQAQQ